MGRACQQVDDHVTMAREAGASMLLYRPRCTLHTHTSTDGYNRGPREDARGEKQKVRRYEKSWISCVGTSRGRGGCMLARACRPVHATSRWAPTWICAVCAATSVYMPLSNIHKGVTSTWERTTFLPAGAPPGDTWMPSLRRGLGGPMNRRMLVRVHACASHSAQSLVRIVPRRSSANLSAMHRHPPYESGLFASAMVRQCHIRRLLRLQVLLLCASPRDAAAPPVDRQQAAYAQR